MMSAWYQSIGIIFLYISSDLLKIFKEPWPFKLQINGLRTSQGAYAAKNIIPIHFLYNS
jgi:hypothetical protein